ncbi:MAG: trypsin-like serine protease [Bacteroidota bacterium]
MKRRIYYKNYFSAFVLLVLLSNGLKAQKAEIMLVKHKQNINADIQITDEDQLILYSDELISHKDTSFLFLDYEEKFHIHLNNYSGMEGKDPLVSLYINEVPVIVIHSDIAPGDHEWYFFTGVGKPSLRIVGGTTVSIEDYPWQVFITAGDYICGGTIIADKWVLTAAHCMYDEDKNRIPNEDISILAGSDNPFRINPLGREFDVDLSVIHEDYDINYFENDLALLRTDLNMRYDFVRPINLITEEEVNSGLTEAGAEAIITGWGLIKVEPPEFPASLQKLDLPFVSQEVGRDVWGPLPDNILMAGYKDGKGDACGGDSGGPLIIDSDGEYKLAGVTSWGSSNCNTIGGFVEVSVYSDWIQKNTGVGQNQFTTIRPRGGDFRCMNSPPTPSTTNYDADILPLAIDYEWELEPSAAGNISYSWNNAEVEWAEDFTGEAYVNARARTPGGYTNWAGQRVETSPITHVASQTNDTSVCLDSKIRLEVNAMGADLRYDWFLNGEFVRMDGESVYTREPAGPSYEGVYYCEISGACGDAVSDPIDLELLPQTDILSSPDNINLIFGEKLEIQVIAEGHNLMYSWFKDEMFFTEESSSDKLIVEDSKASTTGLYYTEVKGTCGKDVSEDIYVYVDPEINQFPEGVNIWPTLTTGPVNIAVNSNKIFDIYIYDSMGLRIGSKIFCQYKAILDLSGLSPDQYLIEIRFKRESKVYKVIKL